jgi:hypothetical protein
MSFLCVFLAVGLVLPPETEQALTWVKTLVPKIGRLKVPSPIIVALAALAEFTETEGARQIERHVKKDTKREARDNSQVVKVEDAIKCIDEQFRDPKKLLQLLKGLISAVIEVSGVEFRFAMVDDAVACIREHALQQKNKRSVGKYVKTKNTPEPYSEIISLREGKLHPFIPE